MAPALALRGRSLREGLLGGPRTLVAAGGSRLRADGAAESAAGNLKEQS